MKCSRMGYKAKAMEKEIMFDPYKDRNWETYQQIACSAQETNAQVYLVGGGVRDLILKRTVFDIDLLVFGTIDFIHRLRKLSPSALVCLDKERDIYRIVPHKGTIAIDVTLEGETHPVIENLRERDFTINAMAIGIKGDAKKCQGMFGPLIDPCNGMEDCRSGIIRAVSEENLVKDPLRLLRAYRFAAQLGFTMDEKTLQAITKNSLLINIIAPERIREEWVKLLLCPVSSAYIMDMHGSGLLSQIFPEAGKMEGVDQGDAHMYELWEHSYHTLALLEEILATGISKKMDTTGHPVLTQLIEMVNDLLQGQMHCAKMAALFHDIGKPHTLDKGKRGQVTFYGHPNTGETLLSERMKALRFSNTETRLTGRIVREHMRPFLLFNAKKVTRKAMARFFIATEGIWPVVLLISIADILSTKADQQNEFISFVSNLASVMCDMEEKQKKGPLVTGVDLHDLLSFPQGKEMGKALSAINLAYLRGAIKTKAEALAIAKSFL